MSVEPVPTESLHAWAICLRAAEEARRRGDRCTGTDHLLLVLFEDPSIEKLLGVNLEQARQALDSLDVEALASVGLRTHAAVPAVAMRDVPKRPRLRDVARKDRLRMAPAAKKVLQAAVKPNRRKAYVTAPQVLAQIIILREPDPAAVLLAALGVNTSEVRRRLDAVAH